MDSENESKAQVEENGKPLQLVSVDKDHGGSKYFGKLIHILRKYYNIVLIELILKFNFLSFRICCKRRSNTISQIYK